MLCVSSLSLSLSSLSSPAAVVFLGVGGLAISKSTCFLGARQAQPQAGYSIELASLDLSSRPEDFDAAKNIPILKALLDGHIFSRPIIQNPGDKEQLDIDEYELFSRQCDHDIRSFTAWQQKLSSARGAIKFREQDS